MLEVKGKYNTAKIFTDVVDEASIAQVLQLCNQEFTAGSRIRLMPDVHAGAGCTVGTTMTIADRVVPNLVGVDIGCGMETVRLVERELDWKALDELIYARIPSGFEVRGKAHPYAAKIDLQQLACRGEVNLLRAEQSIGTLGGGNHFIEVDRDEAGNLYLVVHSGSRHLGLEVANYYQRAGYEALNGCSPADVQALIDSLKAQGKEKQIESAVKKLRNTKRTAIPRELCYVQGELFDQYIHDMHIVQQFAMLNRQAMMDEMVRGLGLHIAEQFTTIHNYIDTEAMILRKGAVSAKAGERLLIPINMRDGSLICTGLGNEDWNCSAPHGAGRLMSRAQAKQRFTVDEFQREMEGVYTTSVGKSTLDECPMAYKGMADIVENIGPTAKIEAVIKPIYNFKAGEESL
ncbi:RtcB family protein [Clostridiaceae bacterium NSJ-31]|uniref:3'-phosphate/5'-hydroxy nucleic acid ligase n=1 Tax=Ligaoa zhengdingensis TaxID=2763658 RepID=A0A926DW78_9FIRM|nr:RtcB family protein [Ligaoa zhengdingensis]MBC8546518.1 RtcB family protein [Ligaoa zhengdingensis]